MKVVKRVMMVMLAAAMLLVTEYVPVHADSIKRKTESSAVELKSGEKKMGELTSDYILQKGTCVIRITPGKVIKSTKKFTIASKYAASKFEDVKLNDKEKMAQSLSVYDKKDYN